MKILFRCIFCFIYYFDKDFLLWEKKFFIPIVRKIWRRPAPNILVHKNLLSVCFAIKIVDIIWNGTVPKSSSYKDAYR